jgi:hypothetical protein
MVAKGEKHRTGEPVEGGGGAEAGACSTAPADGSVLHINVASVNIKKIDLKVGGRVFIS